jgi:hypothetical protein
MPLNMFGSLIAPIDTLIDPIGGHGEILSDLQASRWY